MSSFNSRPKRIEIQRIASRIKSVFFTTVSLIFLKIDSELLVLYRLLTLARVLEARFYYSTHLNFSQISKR
jgi:hypothetical protein